MSQSKPADRHAPQPTPEDPASAPSTGPDDALTRLKEAVQQAKDQYLRSLAETENTKKRLQREKEDFVKYAAESIVRELLPIVDSLDQALVAVDKQDKQSDSQAVIKGVHLIYRQLVGLLAKEGVARIVTQGARFDPHLHEAIGQVESPDASADGSILEEVQVGYTMHGKLLRPALVKVAKHTAHPGPPVAITGAGSTQQTADRTPPPDHEGQQRQPNGQDA